MKTSKGYEQAYNAQAAVDAEHHVIVAQDVTEEQNDHHQLIPVIDQVTANLGQSPKQVSADAGYYSEANIEGLEERQIDGYIATGRQKHGTACPDAGEEKRCSSKIEAMRQKLRDGDWESPYRLRKHTVEPVFGNMKEARGFRRFLRRGSTT